LLLFTRTQPEPDKVVMLSKFSDVSAHAAEHNTSTAKVNLIDNFMLALQRNET